MNYENYLQLPAILNSQQLESEKANRKAHDEMLFIVIHQTYELWFKQMLYELDSILDLFSKPTVDDRKMGMVVSRLHRMNEIMHLLVEQVQILETMTPMDFLDFRDLIYSASGFQSFQFRLLENKLGLREKDRLNYNSAPYHASLSSERSHQTQAAEKAPTLFDCMERWLLRTPFLDMPDFNFWEKYKEAANIMFQQDESFIERAPHLAEKDREFLRKNIDSSRNMFAALFDEGAYEKLRGEGVWRLSYRSVHAALLIQLYRDQPVFQLPFRLITEALDLDSQLTQWRYRHTILVRRMLGSRIGTGGSSGAKYLQESADKHKIFEDFYKLTTFFIPSSKLPHLPEEFSSKLGFAFESRGH